MRARYLTLRVLASSLTLGILWTALAVASALAGDIKPPVPK